MGVPAGKGDQAHDHVGEGLAVELQPGEGVEQHELGSGTPQGADERPAVGLTAELVAVAQVAYPEGGGDPDAGLERLRQPFAVPGMPAPVGVEDQRDVIGDALLGLPHHDLPGAGAGPPHDAAEIIAGHVLAHAVELEAGGPRLRDGRADGRILELAGEGPVGDELHPRVNEQLEGLGHQRLPPGQAQWVAGHGHQRADLVDAPAGAAQAVTVRHRLTRGQLHHRNPHRRAEPLGHPLLQHEGRHPAAGGELDLDVEPVALLGPGEEAVAVAGQAQAPGGDERAHRHQQDGAVGEEVHSRARHHPGHDPQDGGPDDGHLAGPGDAEPALGGVEAAPQRTRREGVDDPVEAGPQAPHGGGCSDRPGAAAGAPATPAREAAHC